MKKWFAKWVVFIIVCIQFACCSIHVLAEEYEYDALDRVTKVIYEDGSYVEYSYDGNGNITNVVVYEVEKTEETASTEPEPSETESEEVEEMIPSSETKPDESESAGETEPPDDEDETVTFLKEVVTWVKKIEDTIKNWFCSFWGF